MDDVRNKFPDLFPVNEITPNNDKDFSKHEFNIYLGEYYAYLLDHRTNLIRFINPSVLKIHQIDKLPEVYDDIAVLLHPDDVEFIKFAEIRGLEILKDFEEIEDYSVEYTFRMKNKDNEFDYFVHQSIHIRDPRTRTIKYTYRKNRNLNNIITQNKYNVTVRHHITNKIIDIFHYNALLIEGPKLSNRELDVLKLIVDGYTDKEIAEKLFLSFNTVRTHRKNILRKTELSNSVELVNKYKDFIR